MSAQPLVTRRLGVLLGASLLNWTTGNGLFPLLPLFALERGATVEGAGVVLAAGFGGLAAGSLAAPRLAGAVGGHRRLYVGAALLQGAAYALIGRAAAVWQLLALLVVAWLGAGLATTAVHVMASRAAGAAQRGRAFGLLAMAPPLGAMVGASALGAAAGQGGYRLAFEGGALLALGAALVVAVGMPAEGSAPPQPAAPVGTARPASARAAEGGLLLAALLASTALFVGRLATPLTMRALSFDPQAIASTAAIGGLVTAPVVPLLGILSDRLGRRPLLVGTYAVIAAALGVLALAERHWQFALAAALLSLAFAASGSVAAALAGDLIAPAALPGALGRLSASTWVAALVAFAGGGALLGRVPAPLLCLLAALLALAAIVPLAAAGRGPDAGQLPSALQG